jgi:alpha-ketoglutarate-dependent taurine dioxygenase
VTTADGGVRVMHTKTADPAGWMAANIALLRGIVAEYGAVLVRGLGIGDVAGAARVCRAVGADLMTEFEGFAPRDVFEPGIYSGTKWPADQPMCMHHELSQALEFPGLMVFVCLSAPRAGGATALADSRRVLADLPSDLVARFERDGWRLSRGFSDLVGLPWRVAFGSAERAGAEKYLKDNDIGWEWRSDGGLRTSQVRPAVRTHPVTGERCWFNQIAFLNEWTMDPAVREYLRFELGADGLPFNTSFGDGTPLTESMVSTINQVYDRHTVREPWQDGDLLLVDNIAMAHSREPYHGERHVVVAMADPVRTGDRP